MRCGQLAGVPGWLTGGGGSIPSSRGWMREGRRGDPFPKQQLEWPGRRAARRRSGMETFRLAGIFSSDWQLLGQTREIGGSLSRKLSPPPLCCAGSGPWASPCLPPPGLGRGVLSKYS